MGASSLSHQDILDLQQIAQHLPTGDPRQAKVSTLLNSEPTEFEQDRSPENREGFLKGAWNTVKGIPGGIASAMYDPQMAAVDTAMKIGDNDAHRKDEGRSGAYRGIAGVGDALGIDSRGMEDAADRGDTSGVLGHAAGSAAPYVAPLVAEGIGRGVGAAARPVGRGMVRAANVIDPDLVGLASPRLAHAQRLVSKAGNVLGKLGKADRPPAVDAPNTDSAPPVQSLEESDTEEARRRPSYRGNPQPQFLSPDETAEYAVQGGMRLPSVDEATVANSDSRMNEIRNWRKERALYDPLSYQEGPDAAQMQATRDFFHSPLKNWNGEVIASRPSASEAAPAVDLSQDLTPLLEKSLRQAKLARARASLPKTTRTKGENK